MPERNGFSEGDLVSMRARPADVGVAPAGPHRGLPAPTSWASTIPGARLGRFPVPSAQNAFRFATGQQRPNDRTM